MTYEIEFTQRATKDLRALDAEAARRIVRKISELREGLTGDVKALVNFSTGYRLRVGDYRVLFDIEAREGGDKIRISVIVVQRVRHRREVYR